MQRFSKIPALATLRSLEAREHTAQVKMEHRSLSQRTPCNRDATGLDRQRRPRHLRADVLGGIIREYRLIA